MSGTEFAPAIRVGKRKFHYVYNHIGNGTYKCVRGSDWKNGDEKLWLIEKDGHWYAFDGPNNHTPTSVDHEKVRFVSTDAEAHKDGRHSWTMMMSKTQEVGYFDTTIIEAMSGTEFAAVIRIGKPKFQYVYNHIGNGTYKCVRGSDWKNGDEKLWLIEKDGHWYAFDGPNNHTPTSVDHEKVRFVSTDAEAHKDGRHSWTMMMSKTQEVGYFDTTIIRDWGLP